VTVCKLRRTRSENQSDRPRGHFANRFANAPPVDEMNQLLMGLANAAQRSFHLLANRIENLQKA
jgi:hypothetical protein